MPTKERRQNQEQSDRLFGDLSLRLKMNYTSRASESEKVRWGNVFETYSSSPGIKNLARKFFSRTILKGSLDYFSSSFIKFTTYVAQYEQLKSGEPGKDEIIYPNDLWENISAGLVNDNVFDRNIADYCASKEHQSSDFDIVRVFEYVALDTAMEELGYLSDRKGRSPFNIKKPESIKEYFTLAKTHISEIAEYLQNSLTWEDIFRIQEKKHWKPFRFFLDQEYSYKMSYPDRYTRLVKHIMGKVKEAGLIPEGKHNIWLVGAGDAPELYPLEEELGLNTINQIWATDLYAPNVPFPMVKALMDGKVQSDPKKMIMDVEAHLIENGFSGYREGINIVDDRTIPPEIKDVDIATMFGVLVNIDGPSDLQKFNHKQAIQNWIKRGREGAIFISVWLGSEYLPISAMVLRKISQESVDVEAIKKHLIIGSIFKMTAQNGKRIWTDEDIKQLGIEIIFPFREEFDLIQPGESYMRRFMNDRVRGACSMLPVQDGKTK